MKVLSQFLSPIAFDAFQFALGGTIAKRQLVLDVYSNQRRVLEIGCSTGNIASAFLDRDVDYTGVDIDGTAIEMELRLIMPRENSSGIRSSISSVAICASLICRAHST